MPRYSDIEIDIVQDIVESSGSIFHPVTPNNFQGIHGIVEIVVDEIPINISFGIHVVNSEDCYKNEFNNYEVPCNGYCGYFERYSLPVVIIVMDTSTNEGFWIDFSNTKIINDTISIPSTLEAQFNFKSFNIVVIDFFINNKKRFFLIETFLKEKENQELKCFLEALFKVFDISIPWVLQFEFLDELIEATGFTLVVSDKSILDLAKEVSFNGGSRLAGTHNYFQTHFINEKKLLYCSPMMLIHLGERYEKLQKL
jgi:hypothetical protein